MGGALSSGIVWFAFNAIVPLMIGAFIFGVMARIIIYLTVKSEWKFASEFEHRVEKMIIDESKKHNQDFHDLTGELLERTHFELYLLKAQRRARRMDYPVTMYERLFGIIQASKRIVEDTLKQTQYVKHQENPDFDRVARFVFATNPYFNKFLGVVPKTIIDDVVNVIPGLLIICGILGTFVGIVTGIPELKMMDVTDIKATGAMLDHFLMSMSFAMTSSILGMVLSLILTLVNTAMSPYALYVDVIDIYKNSLSFIWQDCIHSRQESLRLDSQAIIGDDEGNQENRSKESEKKRKSS